MLMAILAGTMLFSHGGCQSAPSHDTKPGVSSTGTMDVTDPQASRVERARALLGEAIGLLEAHRYRDLLERTTEPHKLEALRSSGRFDVILQRFEGGWGDQLLAKLRDAQAMGHPSVRDDGAIMFDVAGPGVLGSEPIVSIVVGESNGVMFFTD